MITAVQERADRRCWAKVAFGVPLERHRSARGPIALFTPGTVVAYRVRQARFSGGWVFRTASSPEGRTAIPGVSPAPHMLIGLCPTKLIVRAVLLLKELEARGVLDELSDTTYLRAATALGRSHLGINQLADALLRPAAERPWIS